MLQCFPDMFSIPKEETLKSHKSMAQKRSNDSATTLSATVAVWRMLQRILAHKVVLTHLRIKALFLESLHSLHDYIAHTAVAQYGHIPALPHHLCLF